MSRVRLGLKIGGAVVVVVVLALVAFFGWVFSQFPPAQNPRIAVGEALVGISDGRAYSWIVRSANGAALVDVGMEADAGVIVTELAAMGLTPAQVHTILLTHGHDDHFGGLGVFPNARIVAGPGEGALMRGEIAAKGVIQTLFAPLMEHPPVPRPVEEITDGASLDVDGETITAIHVPGHTGGSTMYLWNDTLFTGDSLAAFGGRVDLLPAAFADDIDQNRESLRKLLGYEFTRIADGHAGVEEDAHGKLERFLNPG